MFQTVLLSFAVLAFLFVIISMAAATILLIKFVEGDKAHHPLLIERWWYTPLRVLGYLSTLLVGMSVTTYLASEWGILSPLWFVVFPLFCYTCWRNAGYAMEKIKKLESFSHDTALRLAARIQRQKNPTEQTGLRRVK